MKLEHHELSNLFPMMSEDQFTPFLDGMKKFGYDKTKPIVLLEGKILDGRNRNKAGTILGFKVPSVTFTANGMTALDFVIGENLNRRHLNTGQLAIVSLNIYDALRGQFMVKDRFNVPTEFKDGCNAKRAVFVSKMFGIGRTAVTSALKIRTHANILIPKIMSGEINLSKALKLMPKIRSPICKRVKDDQVAVEILKKLDPQGFKLPTAFDSYEKFFGEHFKKMNDAGYIMQVVLCARKSYVQIVKQNQAFRPWGNSRNEYDFKTLVVGVMRDVIK